MRRVPLMWDWLADVAWRVAHWVGRRADRAAGRYRPLPPAPTPPGHHVPESDPEQAAEWIGRHW